MGQTAYGKIPNLIQIDKKNCVKKNAEVSAFSNNCDLGWKSKSSIRIPGIKLYSLLFSGVYHHTKFEGNQPFHLEMQANIKVFVTKLL